MDYEEAITLFRSEDTQKQLQALKILFNLIEIKQPTDEILNELIERGLSCEKSQLVRELSFQYISLLYKNKIIRWSEVRAAVITEMGTAETSSCLCAAIKILHRLPISDLILFCGSKDGISVMKSCLLSPLVEICAISIENLGPLLIDAWLYVQSINAIDGYLNVESTSEARRFRDDISDFVLDMIKNFAEGLIGKAAGMEAGQTLHDHSKIVCSYFTVIGDLFERYCQKFDKIREWNASILGSIIPSPQPDTDTNYDSRSASLSLLIKQILPIILPDPYFLFQRAKQLQFHPSAFLCISNIMLTLLHNLPSQTGPITIRLCTLVFEDKPAMQFGTPEETDETANSRSKPLNISVIELIEEWIDKYLIPSLSSPIHYEVKSSIYSCLSLILHPHFAHYRTKISQLILEHSHRIIHNTINVNSNSIRKGRVDLDLNLHPLDSSFYREIIPWTLLSCKYVPRSILIDYIPYLLSDICCYITDEIARTKLITEVVILLLINVSGDGSIAHPELLFQTLGHPVISGLLSLDSGNSLDNIKHVHCFRERFIASLCRTITKLLPITIAYVISAYNKEQQPITTITSSSSNNNNDNNLVNERLPYNGVGCYAELCNSTLRSSTNYNDLKNKIDELHLNNNNNNYNNNQKLQNCSNSVELALQQLDNLVASSLFVLRSSHRCILWSISGFAGESAQLSYAELISKLVDIITPSKLKQSSIIQQSLTWAKDAFVDTLSALLTLLTSNNDKVTTDNTKYQLLIIFSQYLQNIFIDYENKSKIILTLLKNILLRTEQREIYNKLLTSRSELGYLGGWIPSRPPHSFLSIPSQYHALTVLELFVYYNPKLIADSVLSILYECESLCLAESRRQHHIISPLIDQRLNLAIRRVKFYCSDNVDQTISRVNDVIIDQPSPHIKGGFTSPNPTNETKKMISSRRVSAAFTTYDNSMSDAFITPEINRKRIDPITSSRKTNQTLYGSGIVDTLFKTSIPTEYSLPIDVDKEFSAFGSYAQLLENNLINNYNYYSDGSYNNINSNNNNNNNNNSGSSLDSHKNSVTSLPSSLTSNNINNTTNSLNSSNIGGINNINSNGNNNNNNNINNNGNKLSESYVCTTDIIGLIDDVLDSHLIVDSPLFHRLPENLPIDLLGKTKLMSNTYDLRDSRRWKQINGSSDIFTVLCSIISYNPETADVKVGIRIINSSGFKVPIFSIQLLLSSAELYSSNSTTNLSDRSILKVSFDSSKTSSFIDGVEYFHPGGLVERIFTLHFHEFTSLFINLRIIYRDLIPESDSVEIFMIPLTTSLLNNGNNGNGLDENNNGNNGNDNNNNNNGNGNDNKKRFKDTELSRIAKLDCIPYLFPINYLLLPYGGGSLSSMVNYRLNLNSKPQLINFLGGIPKNIYQSLRNRLKRSIKLPVISICSSLNPTSSVGSNNYIPNLSDEITLEYYRKFQQHNENMIEKMNLFTLINSRVRLNSDHTNKSIKINELVISLAWCFQTWWGNEICITIHLSKVSQIFSNSNSNINNNNNNLGDIVESNVLVYWSGWMDIQCDNVQLLSILSDNSKILLEFLTSNIITISSKENIIASLSTASSTSTSTSTTAGLFPILPNPFNNNAINLSNNSNNNNNNDNILNNKKQIQDYEENINQVYYNQKQIKRNFMLKQLNVTGNNLDLVNGNGIDGTGVVSLL